jgi:carbonic anhydrase/acetyltransferase-like protein (isoleucine patch superfamily)
MGAIVMDGAVIHTGSIIAAGSVVLEGTVVEPGAVYAGTPARKVKSLDPSTSAANLAKIAANYLLYSSWYRK